MKISTLAFELKEIDWSILGIVSLILLGVILLAGIILGINKFVMKSKVVNEGEVNDDKIKSYFSTHLIEIIFATAFLILFVLIFAGKFYFSWEYGDTSTLDEVNFFKLIFGGNVTLVNKEFILSSNPLLITSFILILCGAVFTSIFFYFNKENKILLKICNTFSLISIVTGLILITVYFQQFNSFYDFSSLFNEEYYLYIDTFSYSAFFIVFLVLLLALCNVRNIFSSVKYTTQDICEEGILIALAVVLDSFIKFKVQAGGGSIGFAAIPLFIISIRHGAYKGFVASAIMFGLITCMIDGYGFQTYPFDYFIGFGGYCLVGLFFSLFKLFYKNKPNDENYKHYEFLYSALGITVGCIFAMIVRYIGSSLSSIILYDYSLTDALIYNSTYIPFTMLLDWFVTLLLLKPILIINNRFKYRQSN